MDTKTIEMILPALEGDRTLEADADLGRRLGVIDLLTFLHGHGYFHNPTRERELIEERLDHFKKRLAAVNTRLFDRLRTQIQEGSYTRESIRHEFNQYTDSMPQQADQTYFGGDALDDLLDGILELRGELSFTPLPSQNMVMYVPTPARVILSAVDSIGLKPEDVFYDVGSGLGRVAILAHLISGAKVKGVEIDPDHHQRACHYASKLRLSNVEFINADARDIEYDDGTVFFMYTPFMGDIFQAVLDKLGQLAERRPICLCTYGPCTTWAAQQPWLRSDSGETFASFAAVTFRSIA